MKTLEELKQLQDKILILHYACTNIERSPAVISSISVKNYSIGQTVSFSFENFDNEKNLLIEFIKHMKQYQNPIIVAWNQKSPTYGIQHIQKRCRDHIIKDEFPINPEQVTDLDEVFTKKYGRGYVGDPKLRKLAEINNITLQYFVDGKEEIRLFYEKEYKKIENSTNRKVSVIADYLNDAFNDRLNIQSKESENAHIENPIMKHLRPSIEIIMGVVSRIIHWFPSGN